MTGAPSRSRIDRWPAVLLAAAFLYCLPVLAQDRAPADLPSNSVAGRITDASGAVSRARTSCCKDPSDVRRLRTSKDTIGCFRCRPAAMR